MNQSNKENNTNVNQSGNTAKKKFTLDEEARKKIDAEFSEPGYSEYTGREYYHRNTRTDTHKKNSSEGAKKRSSNGGNSAGKKNVHNAHNAQNNSSAHHKKSNGKSNKSAVKKGIADGKKTLKNQKKKNRDYRDYDEEEFTEEVIPKKRHKLFKVTVAVTIICLIVLLVNIAIWLFTGRIWFNEPKKRDFPVRGPIITEDMGEIRWNKFPQQNIQLAFIRATKSTTYVDKNFEYNWEQSASTNLPTGALHVFDPDMDGKEQAKHFAKTVGSIEGRIVPVVDIRFNGLHKIIPGSYDKITKRLVAFVEQIEKSYGVYPIISCDKTTYKKIICNETVFSRIHKTNFQGCAIWYESLTKKPSDDIKWTFWLYTDRARYSYYDNKNYVEVVLYRGSEDQFEKYIVDKKDEEYFEEDGNYEE